MVYSEDSFINPWELEELVNKEDTAYSVYLFGTGGRSERVYGILKALHIQVKAFVDNDKNKQEKQHKGRPVIAPEDLLGVRDGLIIIAVAVYPDIMKQLSQMGLKNVYVLTGLLKYSYDDVVKDAKWCLKQKDKSIGHSDKVLIKVWYGIGDNIISLGILNYIREIDPNGEKYYFITDRTFRYDFFAKLFRNVWLIQEERFISDRVYRRSILEKINKQHFAFTMDFQPAPLWDVDFFDIRTTNIPKSYLAYKYVKWHNGLSKATALERMIPIARECLGIPDERNLDSKGLLSNELSDVSLPAYLPKKYIAFSFGGTAWSNAYYPEKIAVIAEHFIKKSYGIVLLGSGEADAKCNEMIMGIIGDLDRIINLTGLHLYVSFKVISKAELFLGIDSGLAHAAYSLDKNAVVLRPAGTELADCFQHYGDKKMIYIKSSPPCAENCIWCKYQDQRHGGCIRLINPENVIAAMEQILERA